MRYRNDDSTEIFDVASKYFEFSGKQTKACELSADFWVLTTLDKQADGTT